MAEPPVRPCVGGLVASTGRVAWPPPRRACSSGRQRPPLGPRSTKPAIPAAAFSDHTGITATTVTVGNVSTLMAGLFKGAAVGTEAYADYVNSTGGVNGRKIVVDSSDDQYAGRDQQGTRPRPTSARTSPWWASFSLYDNFGGAVLRPTRRCPT